MEKYAKETTTTDILREVFTDARQLKKVIGKLKADRVITVEEKGQATFVTLVKVAVPKGDIKPTETAAETTKQEAATTKVEETATA